jgi:hypothetical protein
MEKGKWSSESTVVRKEAIFFFVACSKNRNERTTFAAKAHSVRGKENPKEKNLGFQQRKCELD